MISTERDAVALHDLRERLAEVADSSTGGDVSRRMRGEVVAVIDDIDAEFDRNLGRCHADTMPTVRHDREIGWTIRCFECGAWATGRTFDEAEEAWNEAVDRYIEEADQ